MAHDLLIKNARIVDGTGSPSIQGSVAVDGGRIVEVGEADGLADRVIDAQGMVVSPGFVDLHTHYDAQVTWDPLCTPSCYHGVTTVLMSNCGYAMAPVRPEDRDYTMGMFSSVEGVSKHTLVTGLPWEWETLEEYFGWLRDRGLGINVAAQVGHSAVRRYVIGPEAHEREATPHEVQEMRRLVREGMNAGAMGFTTSRVAHQKGEFGEPIPSFMASEDELFALAAVLKELDRGIIGINPRTKILDFKQEDRDQLFRLATSTGRMVHWNEFNQRWEYPDQWRSLLDFMENAHRHGASIYAVMRCQRMNAHFNLRDTKRFAGSAVWREFTAQPHDEKLRRLADSDKRSVLAQEVTAALSRGMARVQMMGVAVASLEKNRRLEGLLFVDVARERGVDPIQLFLDIALEEKLQTEFAFYGVMNGDDQAVEAMLKSPATITGISDAGAHLHSECGVDYPTFFLSRWVRERGVFSLEEGVRTLTSVPAELAGFADRGVLKPGAAADLCLFDPDTIAPERLEIWHDLPGGESRHVKRARGIEAVVVNGQVILESGEATGALPGRVLTG